MKKRIAVIITALLIVSLLCSCAAQNKSAADTVGYVRADDAYEMTEAYSMPAAAPPESSDYIEEEGQTEGMLQALTKNTSLNEKIIYFAHASIETVEFDEAIERIYALINEFEGFVQDSYISGSDYRDVYYGNQTYRNASFTIRVPKENYAGMTAALDTVGNVTGTNVSAQNITAQFTDAQARLDTYEAEEQRLIEMMEKAESVEDLISIEARLSEVRYQIEAVTATLRNWQNEVDYSTVSIELREVKELSETKELPKSFKQEITEGFKATLNRIGRFFRNFAAWVIINLPTIVIIAAVIAAFVLVVFKGRGKRVARRRARREERALRRMEKKNGGSSEEK